MKAAKYNYYINDSKGNIIHDLAWFSREDARQYKRYAERDLYGEFDYYAPPYKIVRFVVLPTGEVIR